MSNEEMENGNDEPQEPKVLPLWQELVRRLRESPGYGFGKVWPVTLFEEVLELNRNTKDFGFALMEVRESLRVQDGYYLEQRANGTEFAIPTAYGHEDVAKRKDKEAMRSALRSVEYRAKTLANPEADLTDEERGRMDANLEKASMRVVLMSRQRSFENIARKYKPKLLDNQPKDKYTENS